MNRPRLRRQLLAWYRRNRRDLAWRQDRDPYKIWVSEVMLQQTRVDVVEPYFTRFIAEFPCLDDLARGELDRVLALWSGLGYYRRARSLHAAVRECHERYGAAVPRDPERFRELPGVGPYTTAAVMSIAFDVPMAVADGNVVRVLSRLLALDGHAKSTGLMARVTAVAQDLLAPRRAGDFNQAMMELGALVCTPREPSCGRCPWRNSCQALASGDPSRWPEAPPRNAPRKVTWRIAYSTRGRRILLARRGDGERFAGMWELPNKVGETRTIEVGNDLRLVLGEELARVRHGILDERITAVIYQAEVPRGFRSRRDLRWVSTGDLDEYPLSSLWRKCVDAVQATRGNPRIEPSVPKRRKSRK